MNIIEESNFRVFLDLIDNVYDEIVIWDEKYTLIYANRACYRHYGIYPEELIGKTLNELTVKEKYWFPSSLPYIYKEKKPVIQNQKTFLGIDIVTISTPILDENGNVKYIVQSVRDDYSYLYTKLAPIKGVEEDKNYTPGKNFIYKSESMKQVIDYANKVAKVKAPFLILGETGTGKSLLAKYVHKKSNRKDKPFISINMASISRNIIESEFFGYKKGAFTGANREGKKGIFEIANGGTLFLDEIGEIPCDLQAKFLHVIQEEELIPLGDVKPIKLDIRIICATNCDLEKMVQAGRFREDLYHRLNVFEITMPPLRKRKEDLLLLTSYFLNVFNKKYEKSTTFSKKTIDALLKYPWKGNIRELSNVVERGVLTAEGNFIEPTDLPKSFFRIDNMKYFKEETCEDLTFDEAIEGYEKKIIIKAYEKYKSSRKIAEALGISQSKANRLIQKYIQR